MFIVRQGMYVFLMLVVIEHYYIMSVILSVAVLKGFPEPGLISPFTV